MNARSRHIVVGVISGQSPAVVTDAARFAEAFDAELVCARVGISRYPVAERPDQLAHHQHRPVVVIPVNPVGLDAPVPWQGDEA